MRKEDVMLLDYSKLPNLIQDGAQVFSNDLEKLIFTTSALTTVSACFPNVSGEYDRTKVYSNLYTFIVGSAAAGKSIMKYGMQLGNPIHESLRKNSAFDLSNDSKKPITTYPKVLFIPGDSSYASIVKLIEANKQGVIIAETEADSLSQALCKDFGSFSDLLRKLYGNETASRSRLKDAELTEINNGKLSVLLSGTPSQVGRLIPSAEDGLFSRFTFLKIHSKQNWRSARPNGKPKYDELIEPLSQRLFNYYKANKEKEFEFNLSDSQWDAMDKQGETWLNETLPLGNSAPSIAKRMGLMCYKICMILSLLRHFENNDQNTNIECSDADFQSALVLSKMYFNSSILVYNQLKNSQVKTVKPNVKQFFEQLPEEFNHKDRDEVAIRLGFDVKTGRNHMKELCNSGFIEPSETKKFWRKKCFVL